MPRVAVYVHKDYRQWLPELAAATIHRREALELYVLDRDLVAGIVSRLERRTSFALTVSDGELFVAFADTNLSGAIARLPMPFDQ